MRKSILLVFILFTSFAAFSQDFSNKGKDFWISSGWHYSMGTGNPPVMTLSLTSDVNTTYSIEAYGVGIITSGIIIANQVTNVNIPSTYFTYVPATGMGNGLFTGKAIHVTAAQPIVVYSFTTQAVSSAATLCLPTNVLGKQYYAASYTQLSANPTGNNFITIIAVEDNTTVEIIPTKLTYGGWAPYSVNTISLNKGQIYQVLGAMSGNSGSDLTGTSVRSVASGMGGCKRIAVFSGSGRVWIPRTCSNGADNLYQQLYPTVSWGRKYLTVPSSDRLTNYYRIINLSATANVKLNGVVIPGSFFVDHFYEFSNNTPNLIEGDTSICVVQYFTSADCIAGNPNPYDPDMVILNPVEQNISDVTLISSNRLAHTPITPQHHIHVIMKNSGTAISSFKFDGGAIPPSAAWVTHPQDPAYSYLYLKNVTETYHSLKSDSGFNALAYGYAANETYAYSAGTNVKDLYTHPGTESQYGIDEGAVCTGSPFKFKISLPYKPDSIYWDLSTIINTPQYGIEKLLPIAPADTLVIDSITYVNSRPLYWYSLPGYYTFSNTNSLSINITAFASNADGCGNSQDYILPLDVTNPPTASFSVTPRLCYAEPYVFNETTPQIPKVTYKLWWEFFDPVTNIADTLTGGNPYRTVTHFFATPGVKRVRHTSVTSSGCLTDTIVQMITVPDLPSATINGTNMVCVNGAPQNIVFTGSGAATGGEYIFYYHINSGGQLNVNSAGGIATIQHNPTVAGTFIYTLDSVRILGSTLCVNPLITGQQVTITVSPEATIAIRAGDNASQTLCINNPMTQIRYDIAGGGTGGTVTFVPVLPGVTGTYAGGVVTIQGTPTLSGTFSYTVTPTGPCPYAGVPPSGIITVNNDATITLQSTGTDNQTKCVNAAITNIDYLVAGGATGATIVWVPTTPTGITFTPIGGGVYQIAGASSVTGTFNYTINTQGPCIKPSMGGTLTVTPDATISIRAGDNASQILCINNPMAQIRYDIAGSGTGGTVTFVPVLPGVTGTYAGGVVTIQGTPTLSGTFNYTITPTGPCPYPGVPPGGTITVNDDATIILQSTGTDNQTKCLNTAITNIDYLVAGGATGATITWVPTTPTGITFTPIGGGVYQIAGASSVTGTFNYTINTQGPCIKPSLGGTLTINPAPSASIAGTAEVCQNNPVWPGITFTGSGGTVPYTFTYTIDAGSGPGLPQTITTTGLNTSIQVQQPTGVAGTFTYKLLSVQDGSTSACSQAMNVPVQVIKVNELPNGTISGSNLVCINSTPRPDITFTASGGTVPYTFTYQLLPAGPLQTISTTGSNTSVTLQTPTNVAGTFTYRLISISDGSTTACVQNVTVADVVIGVSDVFPAPDFAFNNPVCIPNAVVQFQNLSNIANGTPLTYLWNFGDGSPTQMSVNPSHQYGNVGPFNVSLRATSNAGCITEKVVAINNIHPQPKANFSFNKPGVCIGDDVTLTDLSDGKDGVINQWHWDMGDGVIKTTSTFTYTYTDTITYNIKLYTINTYNCNSDTIIKQFTVYPYPHVNAGPDRSILEGGQITLSPVVYGNDLQFMWTPNLYLIDNRIEKVKVNKPLTDMTYRLTVTARGGCSLGDDVFVKLLKFPIIPNTFTPNNDGINDTWRIDYLNTYPDNLVQVFTRTGQLVFESRGYNTPWDGTIKGKPLPFDTYYYIIEPGNGREPLTGYVTILK